jgi:hypothetical protein
VENRKSYKEFYVTSAYDLSSNRKEYQESLWGLKGGRRLKVDNLTAICELII